MRLTIFHEHQASPQLSEKNKTQEKTSAQNHEAMLLENHKKFLWTQYTYPLLGPLEPATWADERTIWDLGRYILKGSQT